MGVISPSPFVAEGVATSEWGFSPGADASGSWAWCVSANAGRAVRRGVGGYAHFPGIGAGRAGPADLVPDVDRCE